LSNQARIERLEARVGQGLARIDTAARLDRERRASRIRGELYGRHVSDSQLDQIESLVKKHKKQPGYKPETDAEAGAALLAGTIENLVALAIQLDCPGPYVIPDEVIEGLNNSGLFAEVIR
jgi:hypothetical protein